MGIGLRMEVGRLRDGAAHRLPKVDRLKGREVVGSAGLEALPGKLGQVAWPSEVGRRGWKRRAASL